MSFDGVMLASPTSVIARSVDAAVDLLAGREGWVHELKADGIRALVTIGAKTTIVSRTGIDITWRYPDVLETLAGKPAGVYDGEIIVMTDGRINFPAVHKRDAQGTPQAAARLARTMRADFLAFDVLADAGTDVTRQRLSVRRELLIDSGIAVMPQTRDLRALWQFISDNDMEGVVSKRVDSLYLPRRSRDWVKLKRTKTLSAIVIGYEQGKGSRRATFGALELGLVNEAGQIVRIGSVGSGFTQKDLEDLASASAGLVVEVAYLDVTPNGTLRQPVFSHVRSDVPITDCTTAQLSN